MKSALIETGCAVLLATASWAAAELAISIRHYRGVPDRAIDRMDGRLASVEATIDARLASVEARTDRRLASIQASTVVRVDAATERADARLGQSLDLLDERSRELSVAVQASSAALTATLQEYGRVPGVVGARLDPWTNCVGNGACWQAQFTASLGSARYTMGQIARSAPTITESIQASTLAAQQTAQAAAVTAQNAATITKPGPAWTRWLGVGLGVAAPAAQVALPFVYRGSR